MLVLEEHGDAPIAATGNYGHIVLRAAIPQDYWSFDHTKGIEGSLYEYSGTESERERIDNGTFKETADQPILVGVNGEKGSTELIGLCSTVLGAGSEGSKYNALAKDGETIFFTVLEKGYQGCPAAAPPTTEVYARLHGSVASSSVAETRDVSASECVTDCGEGSGKNFEGASENGEKVFFTSTQKLTNTAVDGIGSGSATKESGGCFTTIEGSGGCNLYEYDFGTPGAECQAEHRCLSLVAGGEVLGVAGIAEDGTWVYFVSRAGLPDVSDNEYGRAPQVGMPNLYAYDTVTGSTSFVATLSGSDESVWTRSFNHPVEVSGDQGQFLLFASSTEGVTPGDDTKLTQLFEYDAETGELVRVTQGEDGFNDNGIDVLLGTSSEAIATVASVLGGTYDFKSGTNRLNIAEDGKTVVFKSKAQLSPLASSAEKGCFNLYEFHWGERSSEGGVRLLSDGRDVQPLDNGSCGATFEAIDASAENVLFTTADPLLASDVDGFGRDIYDARVDGGFAPIPASAACEGGCEGSVSSPAPLFAPPGSASLTGSGNLAPPALVPVPAAKVPVKKPVSKCAKGKKLRHGKCVKVKVKRKVKAKKSERGAGR
jgi:hypothetical protein